MNVTRFCDDCHNLAFMAADASAYACRVCGSRTERCTEDRSRRPQERRPLHSVPDDPTVPLVPGASCPHGCPEARVYYAQFLDAGQVVRYHVCHACRRHWTP